MPAVAPPSRRFRRFDPRSPAQRRRVDIREIRRWCGGPRGPHAASGCTRVALPKIHLEQWLTAPLATIEKKFRKRVRSLSRHALLIHVGRWRTLRGCRGAESRGKPSNRHTHRSGLAGPTFERLTQHGLNTYSRERSGLVDGFLSIRGRGVGPARQLLGDSK